MLELICPVCGKNFIPAPFHIYKIKGKILVCTYKCMLEYEKTRKLKSKQIRPNIKISQKFIDKIQFRAYLQNKYLKTYITDLTNDEEFAKWFVDFIYRYSNTNKEIRYETFEKLLNYFSEDELLNNSQ